MGGRTQHLWCGGWFGFYDLTSLFFYLLISSSTMVRFSVSYNPPSSSKSSEPVPSNVISAVNSADDIECRFKSSFRFDLKGDCNYPSGKLEIIEAVRKLLPKSISICSWSFNSYFPRGNFPSLIC
ncbi:hypothetical protein CDAR_422581 [Caerostris darwini]|uniref:Uncharacterized protein n=1 Tax=Caerostris darwini TaxID=1538125 RepID=A0AAV4RA42_9ARAC|nr:hypothetical protein CDAR_422581 [Caerostris darwini]